MIINDLFNNKKQGMAEGSRDRRDPYDRGYHDGQRMGSNSYHNPYSREDEPTEWDEYKSGFNMAQIELQNDLEDNNFSEGVAEGMSDDMAAMAQKKFPNAYISKDGEEVQKPKNWGKRYTPPAAAPVDLEKQQRDLTARYPNIDELVRRAELNRDPNYERADGQAYYAARDAEQNYLKLRQIQRVIQGLNESLQRTQP